METSFWIKLALSFVIGSLWVTFTTFSAERFGSKVGGLIGGLPSTVVIALLFIGYTQSPMFAAQATTVMPLTQGLNGIFILTFMLLIRNGLWAGIAGSLSVWLIQAAFLYWLDIHTFWISLVGWLVLLCACYIVLEKWLKIPSHESTKVSYPPSQLAGRAAFGGTIIALAVFMGKAGGPALGGIFGSFPAMFLSTLVITFLTGGVAFSRSVGKSLLISGLINVPLYEIMVRYLYPMLDIWAGTVIALLFSLGTGYLTFHFMKTRLS